MNYNRPGKKNALLLVLLLAAALLLRLINRGNHFSFIYWDGAWLYLGAEGIYKSVLLFFHKLPELFNYLFSAQNNKEALLASFSQYKGEGFAFVFVKPFYMLSLAALMFILPKGWHFYLPLGYNLLLSLATIISAYFISRQLRPFIKNDFLLPLLTTFSGINIFFAHNCLSTTTATLIFSLLLLFTFKELSARGKANRIAIGILLALLPATHESLVIVPCIYFGFFGLAAALKKVGLRIMALLQVIVCFILASLFFEVISIVRAALILHFANSGAHSWQALRYLPHFFLHLDLNSAYTLPFPKYSLRYFANSAYVFFDIIRLSDGWPFFALYAFFLALLLLKGFRRDLRIIFLYTMAFLPALALIIIGLHIDRVSAFCVFAAAIPVVLLLEHLFKGRKIAYLAACLLILSNSGNLRDIISIKTPFLEVARTINHALANTKAEKAVLDFSFPELEVFTKHLGIGEKVVYIRPVLPDVDGRYFQQYFAGVSNGILGTPDLSDRHAKIIELLESRGYRIELIRRFENTMFDHPLVRHNAPLARINPPKGAYFGDYMLYRFFSGKRS